MHVVCHPNAMRQYMVNWKEFVGPLFQMVDREAATNMATARLRDELLAYPDIPTSWKAPEAPATASPLLTMQLKKDDLALAFFSTLTTFATPRDITLQQLRIECFYPADSATSALRGNLRSRVSPHAYLCRHFGVHQFQDIGPVEIAAEFDDLTVAQPANVAACNFDPRWLAICL